MWWVCRVAMWVFRSLCGCGKRAAQPSTEQAQLLAQQSQLLALQSQLLKAQLQPLGLQPPPQPQATQPQPQATQPQTQQPQPLRRSEMEIVNRWKRFFLKSRKLADLKGLWGYLGHFLNGYSARRQLKSR